MAPKRRRGGAGAGRRAAPQFAPELAPDVLHAILLPLAGDIGTLCAAACVNTSWRAAAMHPRLWRKLDVRRLRAEWRHACLDDLTNERLAALVRRACCTDADGVAHALVSLRATGSTHMANHAARRACGAARAAR
jgi:hypothetical protein